MRLPRPSASLSSRACDIECLPRRPQTQTYRCMNLLGHHPRSPDPTSLPSHRCREPRLSSTLHRTFPLQWRMIRPPMSRTVVQYRQIDRRLVDPIHPQEHRPTMCAHLQQRMHTNRPRSTVARDQAHLRRDTAGGRVAPRGHCLQHRFSPAAAQSPATRMLP